MIEEIITAGPLAHRRKRNPLGQRRIDEDVDRAQPLRFKQGDEVFQHHLGAFDGKGQDQQIAAPVQHVLDVASKLFAAVADQHRFAIAVAIGGFAQDVVVTAQFGTGTADSAAIADIARNQDALASQLQFYRRRTDYTSCIPQPEAVALAKIVPITIARRAQEAEASCDILDRVERFEGLQPRPVRPAAAALRVDRLELCRIKQQWLDNVGGGMTR